jgi:hypothetical protein
MLALVFDFLLLHYKREAVEGQDIEQSKQNFRHYGLQA